MKHSKWECRGALGGSANIRLKKTQQSQFIFNVILVVAFLMDPKLQAQSKIKETAKRLTQDEQQFLGAAQSEHGD